MRNLSKSYPGNLGFEELSRFYQLASESDINLMEGILERGDWLSFKDLIKKVIHVTLLGGFNMDKIAQLFVEEEVRERGREELKKRERLRERIHQPLTEDEQYLDSTNYITPVSPEVTADTQDIKEKLRIAQTKVQVNQPIMEKIRGKCVVLTGRPPRPFTKDDIAFHLIKTYQVSTVEPIFTKRTKVVIYNKEQLDTNKLRKAQAVGLLTIPYEDLGISYRRM